MLLLELPGCQRKGEPSETGKKKETPCVEISCADSVFCTKCGPNSWAKGYDSPPAYGLFAVWLMMTTEDWENCLKDPKWRKQLAGELKVDLAHLDELYDRAHDATQQTIGTTYSYSNRDLFAHLRTIWQEYKVATLKMPAGTIYPGGTLLRQIAYQFQPMPASTFLQERCSGGGASTPPPLGYGPIASWLMLLTEDWIACLSQPTWLNKLENEFGMPQGTLNDLYQRSEDKRLVSQNQRYSNRLAFGSARVQFRQFLDPLPLTEYGGHPCSGGKTLLQIARGGK
jgi:hypothetical protein